MSPPLAHPQGTLRGLLWESGLLFGDPLDEVLGVEVVPEDLKRLCELLLDGLSETELKDCKAVLAAKGSRFGLDMLSRMQDLATLMAVVRCEWLLEILGGEWLTVHFQPIVSVADPGEVFAYEYLLRGLDTQGELVNPGAPCSKRRARRGSSSTLIEPPV